MANVLNRVTVWPDVTAQATQAFRRPRRASPEHERVVGHLHRQAITRLNAEPAPSCAWYGYLVLGTNFGAKHMRIIPSVGAAPNEDLAAAATATSS
jgi:hypothetical protein